MISIEAFYVEAAYACDSKNINDDKSNLVEVMGWCHQAQSHVDQDVQWITASQTYN